jgi:Mn-dependent DtxR family transcriptional regulator
MRLVAQARSVGVPAEAGEADAEGMEHHASEATLKAQGNRVKDSCFE